MGQHLSQLASEKLLKLPHLFFGLWGNAIRQADRAAVRRSLLGNISTSQRNNKLDTHLGSFIKDYWVHEKAKPPRGGGAKPRSHSRERPAAERAFRGATCSPRVGSSTLRAPVALLLTHCRLLPILPRTQCMSHGLTYSRRSI